MNGEMSVRVWYFLVLGMFATGGFWGAVWLTAGWLTRVWYWWRDRVTPLLEECEYEYTPNEDGTYEWCQKCDSVRPTLLELPPERTWEQMTSHQLPLAGPSPRIRDWLERDDPAEDDGPDGCVVPSSPESASAAAAMRTPIGTLTAARERRAPWWEAEHRAAYESLGFDYPSGLMARVREAAQ